MSDQFPFDVPQEEADAAWEQFAAEHVIPSRMFGIALGMHPADDRESQHLKECDSCKRAMRKYENR